MFERSGFHFFTFRDVDVAVSGWYMLLMAFIAFGGLLTGGGGLSGPGVASGLISVAGITLSLLIHEFGHAFVSKYYGLAPSILLHGFGGLCAHRPASSDGRDALIVFAGPGVELVFGGLCGVFWFLIFPQMSVSPAVGEFVSLSMEVLIWFNIGWGLINLVLPIWPLDGGKLFHLILRQVTDENRARSIALKVSIFVLIPTGIGAFVVLHSYFVAILAVFLLIDNVNALKEGRQLVGRAGKTRASDFQQELFDQAKAAAEAGDWQEAYRLCHQLRAGSDLPATMLERIWEILACASVQIERFDEARSYLERAPGTDAVRRARRQLEAHDQ